MTDNYGWLDFGRSKYFILIIMNWLIFAILFGVYDLEISKAIYDKDSLLGWFGAVFGQMPGYGLIAIAGTLLIASFTKDMKKQRLVGYLGIINGLIILIFGLVINHQDTMKVGGSIAFGIMLFMVVLYKEDWRKYRMIAAVIVILAIINPILFVQITKVLCGRVRFYDLAADYSNFTPWYLPPGPDMNNFSFPSGHAAMGWMFLPLIFEVLKKDWKFISKLLVIILIFGWGIYVSISRVIAGAHYASDVLFPSGVAFVATLYLYHSLKGFTSDFQRRKI